MKKIPTLFIRSEEGKRLVTPVVNPDCRWVEEGLGIATVKYDGSCCMVRDGKLYARYQAKTAPTPEYAALLVAVVGGAWIVAIVCWPVW